jgi:hypothetical protein
MAIDWTVFEGLGCALPKGVEEWRQVPFAPMYDVSSLGRVRSWITKGGSSEVRGTRRLAPVIIAAFAHGRDGCPKYLGVKLHGKRFVVHRLVLEAFVGPAPSGHEGAHMNGESLDNRVDNLAWVTRSENCRHKLSHGTDRRTTARLHPESTPRGEQVSGAKLNAAAVRMIRSEHGRVTGRVLAEMYGVSQRSIWNVIYRRTWRHVE